LREKPTQIDPNVQQVEAQPNEHEPVGWVRRRRPATHPTGTSVARFEAKATAIRKPSLTRRDVKMDQDEYQGDRIYIYDCLYCLAMQLGRALKPVSASAGGESRANIYKADLHRLLESPRRGTLRT
jgi:hypothetical protein